MKTLHNYIKFPNLCLQRFGTSKARQNTSNEKETNKNDFTSTYDLIGPPNPVSNLPPIKYYVGEHENELVKTLRRKREEVQRWNEDFWAKHNADFVKEREMFKNQRKHKSEELNADEMSVFYKDFLDKNWKIHLVYNFTWYRKNLEITLLDFKVKVQKLLKRDL